MKDIVSRIEQIMTFFNLNQSQFARRIGVRQPNLSAIMKRERACGDGIMNKILLSFDIRKDWLLTGEGEMLKPNFKVDEIEIPTKEELKQVLVKGYWVPLIPTEALANSLAEYIGPGVRRTDCQNIISPVPGAEFAITISGDSMEPKFHDGMVVFLKKINDAAFIPWGNTLVLDTENGAFIKDVFPVKDNESLIEARSLNTIYPPLIIPKSSIYGMYRVLNATKFFTTM